MSIESLPSTDLISSPFRSTPTIPLSPSQTSPESHRPYRLTTTPSSLQINLSNNPLQTPPKKPFVPPPTKEPAISPIFRSHSQTLQTLEISSNSQPSQPSENLHQPLIVSGGDIILDPAPTTVSSASTLPTYTRQPYPSMSPVSTNVNRSHSVPMQMFIPSSSSSFRNPSQQPGHNSQTMTRQNPQQTTDKTFKITDSHENTLKHQFRQPSPLNLQGNQFDADDFDETCSVVSNASAKVIIEMARPSSQRNVPSTRDSELAVVSPPYKSTTSPHFSSPAHYQYQSVQRTPQPKPGGNTGALGILVNNSRTRAQSETSLSDYVNRFHNHQKEVTGSISNASTAPIDLPPGSADIGTRGQFSSPLSPHHPFQSNFRKDRGISGKGGVYSLPPSSPGPSPTVPRHRASTVVLQTQQHFSEGRARSTTITIPPSQQHSESSEVFPSQSPKDRSDHNQRQPFFPSTSSPKREISNQQFSPTSVVTDESSQRSFPVSDVRTVEPEADTNSPQQETQDFGRHQRPRTGREKIHIEPSESTYSPLLQAESRLHSTESSKPSLPYHPPPLSHRSPQNPPWFL
ncbi:hypothetical protein BLNAU_1013 [Blattamonas nauphoetae]|uniref:Uncharacterized protein n=1 Tax=Blattamonas nauphoetae TaxID=2049346 RepID=A0ABQ9YJW6_9EUKA|nr:hypothetical protein BLNAU_1013 [Blattamonas nauphoetae]